MEPESESNLTMTEISFHGSINDPQQLIDDGQDPSSLFKVPKNVTVMFRGGFGFAQYKIPGVIDAMMGRDPDGETFTKMLQRHNNRDKFYGSLCYFPSGSECINLALQDEPLLYESGKDRDFAITVNRGIRIDDTLEGETSEEAKAAVKEVQDKGVLIGAGFIAGESLMGVLLAIFIVANKEWPGKGILPEDWFGGIGTLTEGWSMLFYAWFVGVFIMLTARSLPTKGNLFGDFMYVLSDAAQRLRNVFTLSGLAKIKIFKIRRDD